jgi:hypothetical protein
MASKTKKVWTNDVIEELFHCICKTYLHLNFIIRETFNDNNVHSINGAYILYHDLLKPNITYMTITANINLHFDRCFGEYKLFVQNVNKYDKTLYICTRSIVPYSILLLFLFPLYFTIYRVYIIIIKCLSNYKI